MKYALNFNILNANNTQVESPSGSKGKSLMSILKNIVQSEFSAWREHFNKGELKFTESVVEYNEKNIDLSQYSSSSKYYCRKRNPRTWSRHSALISIWEEQRY